MIFRTQTNRQRNSLKLWRHLDRTRMAQSSRSSERHLWAARDGRRAVFAALMLVFVIATTLSDGRLIPDLSPNRAPVAAAVGGEPDDELRTGSILITPADGNICEHRLIDNETWRIRPNGTVRCDAAVRSQMNRSGEYTAFTRIEAIRDGFVSKR
jgi:hypothetical protein